MPTADRYSKYRADQTTIWVSKTAAGHLNRERDSGESAGAALDRILNEVRKLRRQAGIPEYGAPRAAKTPAKAAGKTAAKGASKGAAKGAAKGAVKGAARKAAAKAAAKPAAKGARKGGAKAAKRAGR